jgi:hypothetical protein
MPVMVRGEPGYIDQISRRAAYETAYSDVEIIYLDPRSGRRSSARKPGRPSSRGIA